MRIVITGGAGFIGSNLAKHFMAEHEVLVVDSFRS
ncbi:MAG: NAD-dependent epimerase/dehydratase family protein, partial [Campylobacter sp.]|nr:NAD-dependent epimerase/dehydratase family protein [Campylobacter sp.]